MFKKTTKIMFISILISSTLISISSNSWFGAWIGLEMNLLSFIPLMSENKLLSTETSLKYFFIQVFSSSIMLFSVILMMLDLSLSNFFMFMISCSLLMKSGSAPFHFWLPEIMEGLSWPNVYILMTWQKIAPLMLLTYLTYSSMITLSVFCSTMIGALGGLNQTSLRKLMAYSSINHLGWMLATICYSNTVWITYFLIYAFLNFLLVFLFHSFKISYFNQLFSLLFNKKELKILMFMNLLSLGGLPPFLGFFPKLMSIQLLLINNMIILTTFMVLMTLITLYFYIRLCLSTFLLNYYTKNWFNSNNYKLVNFNMLMLYTFFSLTGLFIVPSMYLFM